MEHPKKQWSPKEIRSIVFAALAGPGRKAEACSRESCTQLDPEPAGSGADVGGGSYVDRRLGAAERRFGFLDRRRSRFGAGGQLAVPVSGAAGGVRRGRQDSPAPCAAAPSSTPDCPRSSSAAPELLMTP